MKSANFWNFWTVLPLHNSNNFACFQVGVICRDTRLSNVNISWSKIPTFVAAISWLKVWHILSSMGAKTKQQQQQQQGVSRRFSLFQNLNFWLGTRIFILSPYFNSFSLILNWIFNLSLCVFTVHLFWFELNFWCQKIQQMALERSGLWVWGSDATGFK